MRSSSDCLLSRSVFTLSILLLLFHILLLLVHGHLVVRAFQSRQTLLQQMRQGRGLSGREERVDWLVLSSLGEIRAEEKIDDTVVDTNHFLTPWKLVGLASLHALFIVSALSLLVGVHRRQPSLLLPWLSLNVLLTLTLIAVVLALLLLHFVYNVSMPSSIWLMVAVPMVTLSLTLAIVWLLVATLFARLLRPRTLSADDRPLLAHHKECSRALHVPPMQFDVVTVSSRHQQRTMRSVRFQEEVQCNTR